MRWWSLVLLVACGSSEPVDPTPRPDADVLRFDASMLNPTPDAGGRIPLDGGTESDAGPETPRWMCNLGRPGTTLGGVVTSYPNIEVRSEPRFRARAVGYSVKRDSRGPLLLVLLEIENVTSESYCGLIPESYLDYVERYAAAYALLLRGGLGVDPEVAAILEGAREAIVARIVREAPELEASPPVHAALRGWIHLVEGMSLDWIERRELPRERLIEVFMAALWSIAEAALGDLALAGAASART